MTGRTAPERAVAFAGNRCPRCHQNNPPTSHEHDCAAWHREMTTVEKAARAATKASPSYPVATHQAIDLLAHLRTARPGQLPVPDADRVVQLVLDLGWRPFQGSLAAPVDSTLPDPAGTGDLLAEIPP